jgi:arylsulfatase A-like enzyme
MNSVTRRALIGAGAAGAVAAMVVPALTASAATPAETQAAAAGSPPRVSGSRPNIVVYMCDDMRQDDLTVLPTVRSLLGAEGVTFANCFTCAPHCAPSRAALFTGVYGHNNGVLSNSDSAKFDFSQPAGIENFTDAIAAWLQARGYYTSLIGKVIASDSATAIAPGYNDWFTLGGATEYQDFNFEINNNGTPESYSGPDQFQSDVLTQHAIQVIESLKGSAQPFFITIAPSIPHLQLDPTQVPPVPASRFANFSSDRALPRPPSFNEADVSDKPLEVRQLPLMTDSVIQDTTDEYRGRLASLQAIDDNVGQIYKALQDVGRLDNTIFVFTSDHGWMLGEHRYPHGKVVHYDPATRIPMVIRGPGFPAGVERQQPIVNLDLTATIVDAAGASPTRSLDGESLFPFAASSRYRTDRAVQFEIEFNGNPALGEPGSHYFAARTQNWKYVHHTDTGEEELYDFQHDPYELTNLAGNRAYSTQKAKLSALAASLKSCTGTSCQVTTAGAGPAV